MKHLNTFDSFLITETLKSDTIEVVEKKLSSFFDKLGFYKKIDWGEFEHSPNYQIFHDRKYLEKEYRKYSEGTDDFVKTLSEKDRKTMIKSYERGLKEFKYGDIFIFTDKNSPQITDDLLHLIESVGYFISVVNLPLVDSKIQNLTDKTKIKETLKNLDRISIMIEPYYDTKVDFKNKYLYHTTDKKNLDKILQYGLIPKSKNTRSFYPERIYLSPNRKWMESIRGQLNLDKAGEYIDIRIENYPGLSLYKDVRFKGGFYTYDNIHPKFIKKLSEKRVS